jgi:hypothetical protein
MKDYTKTLEKAYGTEPVWSAESYATEEERDSALQRAFAWYWGKGTNREKKRWVLDYCKYAKMEQDTIKAIAQNGIKSYAGIGYLCRMLTRGAPLTDDARQKVASELDKLKTVGVALLAKRQDASVPSIQERTELKYREYLGDIDAYVDSVVQACVSKTDVKFDPVGWASTRGVKPMHCSKIAAYIESTYLAEMAEAYSGKDEQLVEGYSFLTKPRFKKLIQMLSETVKAFKTFADEKKSSRKPRKKKVKTASQLTKKMKFLAESKEYGLKSISPEKIISSTMLVVFNEKYRTLTVYHAKDPRGLGVKGTTITNYDEEKSVTKKLRKPKEVLAKLSGVRAVTNAVAAIKTKPAKMTGRINENTVLVGAY